jgi:ribosomal protein S18 acetylase RimI-like enzyme
MSVDLNNSAGPPRSTPQPVSNNHARLSGAIDTQKNPVGSMLFEIAQHSAEVLIEYAAVPIAFEVRQVLHLDNVPAPDADLSRFQHPVHVPWVKNYDATPGNAPLDWPARFDVTNWVFLTARAQGICVGGAVAIARSAAVELLGGRDDLALLWDIRVAPTVRGQGIGSALLQAAETTMRTRGARAMMIETQNVNVAACHFYRRQGYQLKSIERGAYAEFPDEVQLLWRKDLAGVKAG